MSRIIKIIDKDTIEIADYRCSAVLYPEIPPTLQNIKDQMDHCEDWCVFKRTINPFQMYAENEDLEQRIYKAIEYIKELPDKEEYHGLLYDNEEKKELLDILKGVDKE